MSGKSQSNAIHVKVAIIGAGIAGLAAARTLESSNFNDYIIVEAQSKVGGRIDSIPWNDGWIEAGAQFFHGTGSTLAQLAQERGFLSDIPISEGEGIYIREDGTQVNDGTVRKVRCIVENILEDCEKYANQNEIEIIETEDSIENVLKKKFHKKVKLKNPKNHEDEIYMELFDWNRRFLVIDNACDNLDNLSLISWGKYKTVDGPELNVFKRHYMSVVESIVNELSRDRIKLNSPVIKIEWKEKADCSDTKPIHISILNNDTIYADCVIVTCSLGFLKQNHKTVFSPALPNQLIRGIECMGFGVINKVFLSFDEPWWGTNIKGFQFLWRKSDEDTHEENRIAKWTKDISGFDVLGSHNAVLLGWVGGSGAHLMETLSEDQIIKDCLALLKFFLKTDNVPEPNKCFKTSWGSNYYTKGAYSHITRECDMYEVSPKALSEPIWGWKRKENGSLEKVPILMLAGEATHENYYSTTHGAYETGENQAQIYLDHLQFRL